MLIGILFLGAYLFFLPFIGFLPASYIFYFTFNLYLGDEGICAKSIMISFGLTFVVVTSFYLVFKYFLEVPLPAGSWFAG